VLLDVKNLQLSFDQGHRHISALDGVSFSLDAGETLCLVGESGSGKTITALSIGRLLPSPPAHYLGGSILLEGRDALLMSARELRSIRGRIVSYIFQDPASSLNPVYRVGTQVLEVLKLHRPAAANQEEVIRLLKSVGIAAPETRAQSFPHELSGGMQQRVMIAIAMASNPKLLIADEPTTALDVTIQAQIIEQLLVVKRQSGMAVLLITHNLGLAAELADRIAVMYAGQIVEIGPTRDILDKPFHPYTQALLASVPALSRGAARLKSIPGTVPRLGQFPQGCRFHPRCPVVQPVCPQTRFELLESLPGRWCRCPYHLLTGSSQRLLESSRDDSSAMDRRPIVRPE
jgi:oligopeptide/dipeptide ABC transporter ATP-binding protein